MLLASNGHLWRNAGDFTRYDESAIKQMNRNISLIRYKKFGEDLLMFEQIDENVAAAIPDIEPTSKPKAHKHSLK